MLPCHRHPPRNRYILQTYARPDIVFTHGEGARMYDAYGKEYLDFAAGIAVNALGEAAVGWCGRGGCRLMAAAPRAHVGAGWAVRCS